MTLRSPLFAIGLSASLLLAPFSASAADPPVPEAMPRVKVLQPRAVRTSQREEVTGSLFPARALALGFEVGGRLEKVWVTKGEKVKEGQVLAQLNPEIADAQVAQAEAGVAAAEAGSSMATDVAERNVKLQASGSVSDLQSKGASTSSKQAAAQVGVAKAGLAQARAARKRHAMRAPFAATVIDVPEQVGGTVGPGMPLVVLEQLDTLVLKTTLAESARGLLKVGTKVKVSSVAGSASTSEGVVKVLVPSADPVTRRIPVEIAVPNADGRFLAHTLARVQLVFGEEVEAQAITASALGSNGGDHVLVVGPSGAVRRVAVTVVERGPKEVVVRAAEPLLQVIDYPSASLVEGTRVSAK